MLVCLPSLVAHEDTDCVMESIVPLASILYEYMYQYRLNLDIQYFRADSPLLWDQDRERDHPDHACMDQHQHLDRHRI